MYVGALGRLYGPNEDRGLYKTDRRRQDLGEGPLQGRPDRRHRHRDEPGGPRHAHRRDVAARARRLRQPARHAARRRRDTTPTIPRRSGARARASTRRPTAAKSWKRLAKGLPARQVRAVRRGLVPKGPERRLGDHRLREDRHGARSPRSGIFGVTGEDGDGGAHITRVTPKSPAETGRREGRRPRRRGREDPDQGIGRRCPRRSAPSTPAKRSRSRSSAATRPSKSRRSSMSPRSARRASGPPPTWLGLNGESLPDGIKVTEVTETAPPRRRASRSTTC